VSDQTWMDMVDDPEADVYETLRAMHKDKTAFEDHPVRAGLAMQHAGKRLEAELGKELPGLKIELLRADIDLQWLIFRVSFYMLGGWTSWNCTVSVLDLAIGRRPIAPAIADLFVTFAVGYFANRIRKGEANGDQG
jgi:hypothetical protein